VELIILGGDGWNRSRTEDGGLRGRTEGRGLGTEVLNGEGLGPVIVIRLSRRWVD